MLEPAQQCVAPERGWQQAGKEPCAAVGDVWSCLMPAPNWCRGSLSEVSWLGTPVLEEQRALGSACCASVVCFCG